MERHRIVRTTQKHPDVKVSQPFLHSQVALDSWRDANAVPTSNFAICIRHIIHTICCTTTVASYFRAHTHTMLYGSTDTVPPTRSSHLFATVSCWTRPSTAVLLVLLLVFSSSSIGDHHSVLGFVPHSTMQRPSLIRPHGPVALGYPTSTTLAVSVIESATNDGSWARSTRRDAFVGAAGIANHPSQQATSLDHETALSPLFVLPKHSASRPTQPSIEILSLMEVSLGRVSILIALILLANAAATMGLP
jgi:hypothetical protein